MHIASQLPNVSDDRYHGQGFNVPISVFIAKPNNSMLRRPALRAVIKCDFNSITLNR